MSIVDTDAFLDMPQTSQLLYMHLSMRADDDGFVGNPKKIMRMIQVGEDDMKILVAKRFVLGFESGVVVIKHWLIHNTIRKDRYTPTAYQKELKTLKLNENKAYTESGNQLATKRQPSIEEKSIDIEENRKEKDSIISEQSSQINPLIKLFESVNPSYEKFFSNKTQRSALQRLVEKYTEEKVAGFIKYLPIINADKYAKGKSITPLQLEDNLAYIVNHFRSNSKKITSV